MLVSSMRNLKGRNFVWRKFSIVEFYRYQDAKGRGRFCTRNLIDTLRDCETNFLGAWLAAETKLPFTKASEGDQVAAHEQDAKLRSEGAPMGIAGRPVQVCNPEAARLGALSMARSCLPLANRRVSRWPQTR